MTLLLIDGDIIAWKAACATDGRVYTCHDGTQFKYKKEAKAYAKELSGAVERKEIKLNDRHKFMDKFKEYGLLRIDQADMEGSRETVGGVSGYKSYCDKYLSLYFFITNL